MDKNGKVHIGARHTETLNRLCEITGEPTHAAAIRTIAAEIVMDADQKKIKSVPRRNIGIKSTAGAVKLAKAASH